MSRLALRQVHWHKKHEQHSRDACRQAVHANGRGQAAPTTSPTRPSALVRTNAHGCQKGTSMIFYAAPMSNHANKCRQKQRVRRRREGVRRRREGDREGVRRRREGDREGVRRRREGDLEGVCRRQEGQYAQRKQTEATPGKPGANEEPADPARLPAQSPSSP